MTALNEPSQVQRGAPDFIVERDGVPIGHVECKDVGAHLDKVQVSEQIKRYRDGLPNLILSDYLEFRWLRDGELREIARLGQSDGSGRMPFNSASAQQVAGLLSVVIDVDAPMTANSRDLARRMAGKAKQEPTSHGA